MKTDAKTVRINQMKFRTMNFEFTEEQLMIQKAARDFAQNELLKGTI